MIHTASPHAHPTSHRHRRLVALLALAVAAWCCTAAATAMPGPPAAPSTWVAWWSATDPALALGAVLRLLATAVCTYLLAITALDLVATVLGVRPLARLARQLAPAAWRSLVLRPVAAGTLAVPALLAPVLTFAPAGAASSTPAPADADDSSATMTLTWLDAPAATLDPTSDAPPADDPAAAVPEPTIETIPQPPAAPITAPPSAPTAAMSSAPTTQPAAPAPVARPEDSADHVDVTPDRHRVRAGDSFWSIAREHVAAELGRPPSPGEIRHRWRGLIDANAHQLPVPGNPDLIYPGMELVVPLPTPRR